jgi:hypothetical protein
MAKGGISVASTGNNEKTGGSGRKFGEIDSFAADLAKMKE